MRKPQIKVIEHQKETLNDDQRELSDEETKAFLYKNYPDLYKQLYPDTVVEKPQKLGPLPPQKRIDQDVQKSDKVYTYNKYDNASSDDGGFSYKIQITTDMNLNQ